mgnify:CR=1 FL=1
MPVMLSLPSIPSIAGDILGDDILRLANQGADARRVFPKVEQGVHRAAVAELVVQAGEHDVVEEDLGAQLHGGARRQKFTSKRSRPTSTSATFWTSRTSLSPRRTSSNGL